MFLGKIIENSGVVKVVYLLILERNHLPMNEIPYVICD